MKDKKSTNDSMRNELIFKSVVNKAVLSETINKLIMDGGSEPSVA